MNQLRASVTNELSIFSLNQGGCCKITRIDCSKTSSITKTGILNTIIRFLRCELTYSYIKTHTAPLAAAFWSLVTLF